MKYIDYVEIAGFKGFEKRTRVPLGDPGTLVGPNNSGKTSVLQALALWSKAVTVLWEKREEAAGVVVAINRLELYETPVKSTKYLWSRARTSCGMSIEAGICLGCKICPVRVDFIYHDSESVYARADCDRELLRLAAGLGVSFVYPMAGIAAGVSGDTDETLLTKGRVLVLMGQGQTAQIMRNLCYELFTQSPEDWKKVCEYMLGMFGCKFGEPVFDPGRGCIYLEYVPYDSETPLEVALSGRGVQQMLLLLAFVFLHRGGVVMMDEPDAHLERLRQKQVFWLLKELGREAGIQFVVATHSETILDEALENGLVSLANGVAADMSSRKDIRTTLRNLGVWHYCNAMEKRRLLIVEGSTDFDILLAMAEKIGHPAAAILKDALFVFYTRNVRPELDRHGRLEEMETARLDFRQYFHALKSLVPDLRAVAVLDGDGNNRQDEIISEDFEILYWRLYEIENYFITPEILRKYIVSNSGREADSSVADKAVGLAMAECLAGVGREKIGDYASIPKAFRLQLFANVKMSEFAEKVFHHYSELSGMPLMLSKGKYYRLIELMDGDEIPEEVVLRLDSIARLLAPIEGGQEAKEAENANQAMFNEDILLNLIKANPGLNKKALAGISGVNERRIKRYLEGQLKDKVKYQGTPRHGGYFVKD